MGKRMIENVVICNVVKKKKSGVGFCMGMIWRPSPSV